MITDNSDSEDFWNDNDKLEINNMSPNLLNALGIKVDDNKVTTWEPPKVHGLSNSSKVNQKKHWYNDEPNVKNK